ncbi:MAG: DUF1573 domain-containing protein [Planctomycetota bacterium]|jgi:hypothetical protein
MRLWIALGLAVGLGVAAGLGTAALEFCYNPWDGRPEGARATTASPIIGPPEGDQPELHVDSETHDFGVMDSNTTGRHTFIFANVGSKDLTLERGSTSCKCAVSKLEKKRLGPGETAKVVVEWTGNEKKYIGSFKQTARIHTNDPRRGRVTLTIKGRVTLAARVEPTHLALPNITAGEAASSTARVFGYRETPLKLIDYELLDPTEAEYFDVTFKPLPPDEVKKEEDAHHGHLVEVTVKPGLPVAPFAQTILLKTNYKEAPTLRLGIGGKIVSEIRVFGPGYREHSGDVRMGVIKSQEGGQTKLFLRVRGPFCREVRFEPIEVFPDLLKVTAGEPEVASDGNSTLTPLTIEVPKGSPPADHASVDRAKQGRITLRTHHPTAPKLLILVIFAVEGSQ